MKCPQCQHVQRARSGMTCVQCKYRYVFNPKVSPKMTDNRFLSFLRMAAGGEGAFFTLPQLYFQYVRKSQSSKLTSAVAAAIVALPITFLLYFIPEIERPPVGLGIFLLSFLLVFWAVEKSSAPLPREGFEKTFLAPWEKAKGPLKNLIRKPRLKEPPAEAKFADVYDYGVERIMVVSRDILVDLFVLNGWHTEQRALIISESGYPRYLRKKANQLLGERPDLPVFLLHDASKHGEEMETRLRRSRMLALAEHPVTDLGLSRADAGKFKKLRHARSGDQEDYIPLDALPCGMLITGLTAAVLGGIAFAELLEPQKMRQAEASHGALHFG